VNERTPELDDLLASYALDAVDAHERITIEALLDADPGLRRELGAYHELMAVLADAVEIAPSTPSPAVWDGIRQSIAGDRAAHEQPVFTPVRLARRQRITTRLLGAVAATALAAAAFLAIQLASTEDAGIVAAANELRSDPTARVVALTASGGLSVDVVLGADGVGYVYTDRLPALDAGRTYQLWVINDNGVISAGIFGSDGVAPFHLDGAVAGLAITEEIAGGVVASENDPVAVWLDA